MKNTFLIVIATMLFVAVEGQQLIFKDAYRRGMTAYNEGRYSAAVPQLLRALSAAKSDSAFSLKLKLADCFAIMHQHEKAFSFYRTLPLNVLNNDARIRLSDYYARFNNYDSAKFLLSTIDQPWALQKKSGYEQLNAFKQDSAWWHLSFLVLNTGFSEFSPAILGKKFLFSSNRPQRSFLKRSTFTDGSDFISVWEIQDTSSIKTIPFPVIGGGTSRNIKLAGGYATADNDVVATSMTVKDSLLHKYGRNYTDNPADIFADEHNKYNVASPSFTDSQKIYFTANYPDIKGKNRLRIMEGRYSKNSIENVQAIWFNDPAYSFMHPAVSANGKLLVYAADIPGGEGQFDIYYSVKTEKGFSPPQKFPDFMNTARNEVFPVMTKDGWLYYSSDGLPGLGSLDIYRIKIDSTGNVTGQPEHISYPINSGADDFGWTQSADGRTGFFSSDRLGDDNIYRFSYDAPGAIISGNFWNAYTNEAQKEVIIYLKDESEVERSQTFVTDSLGHFKFAVKPNKIFLLRAYYNNRLIAEKKLSTSNLKDAQLDLGRIEFK